MSDRRILAIMQNQWVRDPAALKRILEKRPNMRRDMIRRLLFAGCKSGRVLKSVFGDWCDKMVWEEASPEIGGYASAKYDADLDHLRNAIVDINPLVIIGFGVIACRGLSELDQAYIRAPHPAARQPSVMDELRVSKERMAALFERLSA